MRSSRAFNDFFREYKKDIESKNSVIRLTSMDKELMWTAWNAGEHFQFMKQEKRDKELA